MATIGKTFSDPDKWEQPWFVNLTPGKKLLYSYLWDRCDHAGVIHITLPVWAAHTGLQIDDTLLETFINEVNQDAEQIVRFDRKLWFTDYIRFNQQSDPSKPLKKDYSFHKHVFKQVQKHRLIEEVQKRDSILLSNFIDDDSSVSIEETVHPKPFLSLNQGLSKPTGKGQVKGNGKERGEGPPLYNSDNTNESVNDFETRNKSIAEGTPFDY